MRRRSPPQKLGAQRNDLFNEMQGLLKQQEDEVAACRAALAKSQESNTLAGGVEQASQGEVPVPFPVHVHRIQRVGIFKKRKPSSHSEECFMAQYGVDSDHGNPDLRQCIVPTAMRQGFPGILHALTIAV